MTRLSALALLAVGLLCLSSRIAHAQVTKGSIRGTVNDAQGGVLPGVTVTAKSPSLVRGPVSVTTNDKGGFRIPALEPGTYEIDA